MKQVPRLVTGAALVLAMTGLVAPAGAQTACPSTDVYKAMGATLGFATGAELGRWQPSTDFLVSIDPAGVQTVALSSTGKSKCSDGRCARVQALLDLQSAPRALKLQGFTDLLDPLILRQRLVSALRSQQSCDQIGGTTASACVTESHKVSGSQVVSTTCGTHVKFNVVSASTGGPLSYPENLKSKLIYAGYPYSTNLYFSTTAPQVEILSPNALVDDAQAGSASPPACLRVSLTNIAGASCTCNGANGNFSRLVYSSLTTWVAYNVNTYVCQ